MNINGLLHDLFLKISVYSFYLPNPSRFIVQKAESEQLQRTQVTPSRPSSAITSIIHLAFALDYLLQASIEDSNHRIRSEGRNAHARKRRHKGRGRGRNARRRRHKGRAGSRMLGK